MKKFLLLVIAILIGLFYSSCKKDTPIPGPQDTIIPETTKIIENETWMSSINSVDTNNYTFSFNNDLGLSTGDIFVSSIDGGYLRKVTSISQNGDEIIVETEFVSITEAIEKVKVEFENNLVVDSKKLSSSAFFAKGVSLNKESLKNSNNTHLNFDINYVIYDADGNMSTTGDQIKLSGSYGTTTTFAADIDIDNYNLEKLAFTYDITKQKFLETTCGLASIIIGKEDLIARIPFHDMIIPAGIPITVQPVIELWAGVNLDLSSQISMGVNESINYSTTVQYLDGNWSVQKEVDESFYFSPPQLSSSLSATVYIKPKLLFKIYRVLSPKVEAKLYGELNATAREVDWELIEGFQAGVGVEMKIWKKSIIDFTVNIIDLKYVVANGTVGGDIPDAVFSSNSSTGEVPFEVNFYDQSTNNPTNWLWEFGDGGTSILQNPSYTYLEEGNYTVSLTVINSFGEDTETKENYIIVSDGGGSSIENEFVNSHFILNVNTNSTVNTSQVASLYNGQMIGDYVVWERTSEEFESSRWNISDNLTLKFAISNNGDYWVGISGPTSQALSVFVSYNNWMSESVTTKDVVLNLFARTVYNSLVEDGLLTGSDYLIYEPRIKNNIGNSVNILYSLIFWCKTYNGEYAYHELMDYWAPVPNPETYDGSGSRSFSISYGSNSNSFSYVISHADNSNNGYAEIDGNQVAYQNNYGTKIYTAVDSYPQTISLKGYTGWSEVDVSYHLITIGDSPTTSNYLQNPGGNFNPKPSMLTLNIGWNEYNSNPVQSGD